MWRGDYAKAAERAMIDDSNWKNAWRSLACRIAGISGITAMDAGKS